MKIDFLILIAFAAIVYGLYVLFCRGHGGGGGGMVKPIAYPTTLVPGGGGMGAGYLPGGFNTAYRNGGVGAAQPQVWYN
jgi:hypothetical protein